MRKKLDYGQSDEGNFKVVDTIGVPHPFCITTRHVAYAADRHGGMLTKSAISHSGGPCGMKGCTLSIHEHETALLVSCLGPLNPKEDRKKAHPELQEYLKKIVDQCKEEGYAGFSFLDSMPSGKHPEEKE